MTNKEKRDLYGAKYWVDDIVKIEGKVYEVETVGTETGKPSVYGVKGKKRLYKEEELELVKQAP